ncbi:leucyl/phenylalanyl-tRNA--protein transferase [Qipengyuania nanhaisediminis]|uniref:leucyl/phenylalanyl-tRNA--protein transferase n=1 Tax=Qipengyuania nanhaisediminis TaxID=604088 RepID=UPI0038B2C3D0
MHSPKRSLVPVDTLLLAYRSGIFPMSDSREDEEVFWVEPRERAIIPLDGLHLSQSLRKTLRADRFEVTIDTAFETVIAACAAPRPGHPESWISRRIIDSYCALHRAGHAHSVECWEGEGEARTLAGGLYGVSFDRVFCGESMFTVRANASKVALAWLVAILRRAEYRLLDCQFMTDHLASMGAVEMPQAHYLKLLAGARGLPAMALREAWQDFTRSEPTSPSAGKAVSSAAYSSPGKRIAHSLTQTS